MNFNLTKLKRIIASIPRRTTAVVGIAAAVVFIGANGMAYGPERQTYTIEHPADKVTFNSITNNPNYGDERNFTTIKDASNTAAGGWKDEIAAENGKEYMVQVYVHNNAAANLNLVATNTRVMVNVPNQPSTKVQLDGFVTADNASPQKIWDSATLKSDKQFTVAYVAGSAQYFNNVKPTGQPFPDSLVTSAGGLVGYQALDGKVPGCFQYSGFVSFRVKVNVPAPDFTVEKKVKPAGTAEWKKSITANPGEKVDYQIGYKNTGTSDQMNVIAQDTLPKGVKYNNGTTTVKNVANPNGNGLAIPHDELVSAKGFNFGNYAPNSNAYIRFSATLPSEAELEACGPNKLINTAAVHTQNGMKSDTAEVIVNKNCQPNECKPGIPMGDARCNPCEPANPKGGDSSEQCALPQTGPAEIIAGLIAAGAITIGVVYYYRSRQELKSMFHGLRR